MNHIFTVKLVIIKGFINSRFLISKVNNKIGNWTIFSHYQKRKRFMASFFSLCPF